MSLSQSRIRFAPVTPADIVSAREILGMVYVDEMRVTGSPITPELLQMNLDHADSVCANAATIAEGEGLDSNVLQLAALLHDISKLDHRDASSGGIDTWHHHYRGAAMAKKVMLSSLGKDAAFAQEISDVIETHSDIPFIRRYWERHYGTGLPSPRSAEALALRDADVIDLFWVGGMSKIVHFRQVPGSDFYREDGGHIQVAIASARRSFEESVTVLSTRTAKEIASDRIQTVQDFFHHVSRVADLQEFETAYDEFLESHT